MTNHRERRPYPGLRSFTRAEADLFFGRESAVDEMVGRLGSGRLLAVLGPSGAGKSSLVRAGLFPALEAGLLHRARADWRIADFRPGGRPFFNLAEVLLRAGADDPAAPADEEEAGRLGARLAEGPRSVVEWCKAGNLPQRTSLLLFVDSFEELFRYRGEGERAEAEALVAALLECAVAPLQEARIYVVVAMRSEYLSAAASIDGLAEAIDKGHYLAPRMSREQLQKAIVGPASVCGFQIEPALVERLLDELSAFVPQEDADTGHPLDRLARRADQLPLMQHVLSLLWSTAADRSADGTPVLTLADYDALGGLREALATHGRDILEGLLPEHRSFAPLVFRSLVAGPSLVEAVRQPTAFGELVEIAHGEEMAVREVVEAFRAPGRDFLTPARPEPLRSATPIDVSHESLIRQWDVFASWLRQEIASAAAWRRLTDLAERHKRGETDLLSGPALASLAEWWDGERPTAAWAKRYGGDFDLAKAFLAGSRRAEAASFAAETEKRQRNARNRLLAFAAVVALLIVTPLTVFAGYSAIRANEEAEHARREAAAAEDAERIAEAERQAAEGERGRAEAERGRAEAERQRAEAEQRAADQARQEALAAQEEVAAAARDIKGERERAEQERLRALAAIEQATTAGEERDRAEEERRQALATRNQALEAAERAESEAKLANEERLRALAAEQQAVERAQTAEAARSRAEEERAQAIAAREEAVAAAEQSAAEAKVADQQRLRAVAARREAAQLAQAAEAARRDAVEQVEMAETARGIAEEERQQAIAAREEAEQAAQRAEALADQERLRALAAIDQARAAEADLKRSKDELARAFAAVEAAQAERERAELERRRALAAQNRASDQPAEEPPVAE